MLTSQVTPYEEDGKPQHQSCILHNKVKKTINFGSKPYVHEYPTILFHLPKSRVGRILCLLTQRCEIPLTPK